MSEDEIIKQIESSFSKNDPKSALKLANQLLKKKPNNLLAFAYKGLSHLLLKEYKEATDIYYEIAHKRAPEKTQNWYFLGRCYKEQKMYSEAIKAYEKSLEIDPKYRNSLINLEFCYREIKDYENAIKIGKKASEFYPKDLHFLYWISYTYYLMEDYPNSFLYLFKSKELYPESKDVRKLYDEIIVSYKNIIYQKKGIFAIKEMNFNEGRIELENKEINLFEEIYSLDVTRYWLKFLNLSNNQIEEISCLDNFQNLFSLNLANNNLEKISGLETAPRIGMLNLEKNNISKIEGLEKLTGLRHLYLSYNDISKIEGLEKNTRLATLYLYDNNITKIEGLDNLKQLEIIRLSRNKIELINGLSNFNYLKEIDLSDNLLTSMKGFGKLDNLKRLDLSGNQLTTIDGLENFENLEFLDMRDNPGLPKFFATLYNSKFSIKKIREYCGLPQKELKEIAIKLEEAMPKKLEVSWEKVEARKRERRIKEAFEGSVKTSDYGLKHNIRERMNALLKLNKPGVCLYCSNNIPEDVNFAEECENTINRFVKKLNLPRKAKDKTKPYKDKHKTAVQQWGVRVGLDGSMTDVIETKMMSLSGHHKALVNNFTKDHFPKLQGIVCKECSDEFIQKTTKFFNKLNSHKYKFTDFVQNIWKSMKQCHEDYMKLYESYIKKRGF